MLSHTSICQVPLVSQLFHFAPWIHTLCLVMIKSLKWMALGPAADNLHPRTVVGVPLLQMLTLTLLLCCNACFSGNSTDGSQLTKQVLRGLHDCERRLEILGLSPEKKTWQENETSLHLIGWNGVQPLLRLQLRERYRADDDRAHYCWSLCFKNGDSF